MQNMYFIHIRKGAIAPKALKHNSYFEHSEINIVY